jgi:hypothetical protein
MFGITINQPMNYMSRVLLENLTGSQLVNKYPVFYGTQRFITASTTTHYLSLF